MVWFVCFSVDWLVSWLVALIRIFPSELERAVGGVCNILSQGHPGVDSFFGACVLSTRVSHARVFFSFLLSVFSLACFLLVLQ